MVTKVYIEFILSFCTLFVNFLMFKPNYCSKLQSRLSPFAIRKVRKDRNSERAAYQRPKITKPKKFLRWFPLINAVTLSRKKLLLPMPPVKNLRKSFVLNNELHRTLYGFIVFGVSWDNVRGINYLNELQVPSPFQMLRLFVVL